MHNVYDYQSYLMYLSRIYYNQFLTQMEQRDLTAKKQQIIYWLTVLIFFQNFSKLTETYKLTWYAGLYCL